MARFTFRLPDIGEGIAEAEIVAWHVAVGDQVEEDGRLADVMTDKATVEMESPVSGKVLEVAGEAGDKIAIGAPLVVLEVEGELEGEIDDGAEGQSAEGAPAAPFRAICEARPDPKPSACPEDAVPVACDADEASAERHPSVAGASSQKGARVLASPAVRKRAADLGIDLGDVRPAEDGRVRHGDLDAFLSYNAAGGYQPVAAAGRDEQVRVIGLRRRIAENMAASKRHIPHFAYVEEYDVTALEETRAQLNAGAGERPRLTLLPFLIAAICKLVPRYPMLNAHYDDEAGVVTRYGSVHVGIAAQTPAGLMVPVLRHAETRNLWQLATEIARLGEAARSGKAKPGELTGSTITVTSLGPKGGIATTPVINRPEVCIIGPNRIVERAMFVTDASGAERIAKRKTMNISMSCDHRVVDGWDAASFAQDLKALIEAPAQILAG